VRELLAAPNPAVELLCATPDWLQAQDQTLLQRVEELIEVSEEELRRISTLRNPQGVLAVVEQRSTAIPDDLAADWSLYLDALQDPGNLGTILRVADWFGIPYVIAGPGTVDHYNPKVVQASMGAFLRVGVVAAPLADICERFPGLLVVGATLDGDTIFEARLPTQGIVVIGNEGQGIADECRALLERELAIPAHSSSGAESLNAAVATGIICARLRHL